MQLNEVYYVKIWFKRRGDKNLPVEFISEHGTQLSLKSLKLMKQYLRVQINRKIPSISYRATFFIIRVNIKLNLLHAFSFLELAKVLLRCGTIEKNVYRLRNTKIFLCFRFWIWEILLAMLRYVMERLENDAPYLKDFEEKTLYGNVRRR